MDYKPNEMIASGFAEILNFRKKLNSIGKKLILDFVPNHMSADSVLIDGNPDLFLKKESAKQSPDHNFYSHKNGNTYAHGRDPFFDGWTDTIQWDFSTPGTVQKHKEILRALCAICDGVRCDMAMLPEEDVFFRTHGMRALPYWVPLIKDIKSVSPDFLFIAEVYWGMEFELQKKGFDYTYDKELYDRLKTKNPEGISGHLKANLSFQEHSLRFIENHDEDRAFHTFGPNSIFYFSLLCFLPGMVLFHDAQPEGAGIKLPVQLGRRLHETVQKNIKEFYLRAFSQMQKRKKKKLILERSNLSAYGNYDLSNVISFLLSDVEMSSDASSEMNFQTDSFELLIFNPYPQYITGCFRFSEKILTKMETSGIVVVYFHDIPSNETYKRELFSLKKDGLFIQLAPGQAHWFSLKKG
ncbi:MAG: alpha-amylase [Leptospira sp.]|nr:alpha-amylase [Leptospira sp.]